MNSVILLKNYTQPPFCEREILRYAGCKAADSEIAMLLESCMAEAKDKFTYKVCYRLLPVTVDGDWCDFGVFRLKSQNLAVNLQNCKKVLLFAATVGVEIDRLIARYGRLSPSKALLFQALGAERIEALCDCFCKDMEEEMQISLRSRFSPGYGDLSLTAQKDIFAVLDCGRQIGLSLNDSLLMSPSKSVTAFAGISEGESKQLSSKCSVCSKTDCAFRGVL